MPKVAAPPPARQATPAQPAIPPPAAEAPAPITPGGPPAPGAAGGRSRVALLVPLSGPNGAFGRAILDAAQIALFDLPNDTIELMPRDTQGTAEGAARAATAAIADGAQLILGPLLAPEVEAAKPLAHAANVNLVAFSTATQLAGDGTYLMGFLPRQQVVRVTAFAKEKGVTQLAALAPQTPYGQLIVDELRTAATSVGDTVTRVEFYDPAAMDLTPAVRRLASFEGRKSALAQQRQQLEGAGDEASRQALQRLAGRETSGGPDFDAVMLPEGGAKLKAVASLLPYYDIDPAKVRLLGTGLWDEPGLGVEPALVGGWFAAPPLEPHAEFEKRYIALYKRKPPRLASLGYDATALAGHLAEHEGGADFSAAAIGTANGFSGVDGIFRFLPDGLVQRGLAVLEIQRGGATTVSPAPETFEDFTF